MSWRTPRRFWEIECYWTEVSDRIVCTDEERMALEAISSSFFYNDGRYSVAVPWKEQRPCLPNNRQVAESRLRSTEKNLKKKGFVEEYQKVIDTCGKVSGSEAPSPEV